VIEPASRKTGYAKPQRADQISAPGIITQQVIQAVADADLVIADLSEHNPNVFYELAIRHGLQSPMVQLLESSQRLPFDIAQMRTIKFDIHDIDSVVQARDDLVAQIDELKNTDAPLLTPISVTRDIKAMWESEDPATHALADVLAAISSLKADVQTQHQNPPTSLYGFGPGLRLGEASFAPRLSPFGQMRPVFSQPQFDPLVYTPEADQPLAEEPQSRKPAPKRPQQKRSKSPKPSS